MLWATNNAYRATPYDTVSNCGPLKTVYQSMVWKLPLGSHLACRYGITHHPLLAAHNFKQFMDPVRCITVPIPVTHMVATSGLLTVEVKLNLYKLRLGYLAHHSCHSYRVTKASGADQYHITRIVKSNDPDED